MKKIITFAVVLGLVLVLSGCSKGSKYKATEDTIYITKDTKVVSVSFYELSNYGTLDTFNAIDDNRMIEYNYSVGSIVVKRLESSVSGSRIKVITEYNNFLSYNNYVGVTFMNGKIKEAKVAYDLEDVSFLDMSGNAVDSSSVLSHEDYYIAIVEQNVNIDISGEILYYSDNIKPSDKSHVKANGEGVCYIVFK